MREHKIKVNAAYWEPILEGDKNFEVRRDDRGYQKGDILVLQKWDNENSRYFFDGYSISSPIIELRREITFILPGGQWGIEPGHVVMGLREI